MSKTLKDYIIVHENILPEEFCKKAIKLYHEIPENDPLKIHRTDKDNWMNFTEVNMLDHDTYFKCGITHEMMGYMKLMNHQYFGTVCQNIEQRTECNERFIDYEAPRIKRYEPGEGLFNWHIDNIDLASCRRVLVMFWYLNDVEEGGETIFDLGDGEELAVKPKQGQVVCFPPFFMFVHKGATPISGPKYVISSYVHLPVEYGLTCD